MSSQRLTVELWGQVLPVKLVEYRPRDGYRSPARSPRHTVDRALVRVRVPHMAAGVWGEQSRVEYAAGTLMELSAERVLVEVVA